MRHQGWTEGYGLISCWQGISPRVGVLLWGQMFRDVCGEVVGVGDGGLVMMRNGAVPFGRGKRVRGIYVEKPG